MATNTTTADSRRRDREVRARTEHPGRHRRRTRRRARLRRARPGRPARLHPDRLLQGPGRSRPPTFQSRSTASATRSRATAPTVDADGTVHLLGRGSQCINTGGEKVYPEEVEECLKLHPTVADAAVVGAARRAVRRGDHAPSSNRTRCRHSTSQRADRPRQGAPRRVQGAQARPRRSTPSAARPTASSTTSG